MWVPLLTKTIQIIFSFNSKKWAVNFFLFFTISSWLIFLLYFYWGSWSQCIYLLSPILILSSSFWIFIESLKICLKSPLSKAINICRPKISWKMFLSFLFIIWFIAFVRWTYRRSTDGLGNKPILLKLYAKLSALSAFCVGDDGWFRMELFVLPSC